MGRQITVDRMLQLYSSGMIGKIEFRNWLALEYKNFEKSRRPDIDEWLEELGQDTIDSFTDEGSIGEENEEEE